MTKIVTALLLVISLVLPDKAIAEFVPGDAAVQIQGTDERFGIDFVNNTDNVASDARYQQAAGAGAKWTRFPIYWQWTDPGMPNWSSVRAAVERNNSYGLKSNVILLGTPSWAATGGSSVTHMPSVGTGAQIAAMSGGVAVPADMASSEISVPNHLYENVFNSDGTVNQNNYWAWFVYRTVNDLKTLGVHTYEMWNEPDFQAFWSGSRADYYQLLKVGYLAAKAADPNATVLFAGLAYFTDPDFFPYVLDLMQADSTGPANRFYFDVVAWHPYVRSYYVHDFTVWSRDQMSARGITGKQVWINETNIPVCDDSSVDPDLWCPARWRGTMDEQASFIIQAYAMGLAGGAEKVFIFQLFDDNVGPHDWYGLVRNDGRTRPSYTAYQVAATYLANPTSVRKESTDDVEKVVLDGTSRGKVSIVWNKGPGGLTTSITAAAPRGTLIDKYGGTQTINASNGSYSVYLPGATYRDPETGQYDVGGSPYILVEQSVYMSLSGTVRDNLGIPIPGATVNVSSSTISTTTDGSGRYFLEIGGPFDISANKAGYAAQPSKALNVTGNSTYDFVLTPIVEYAQNGGFESGLIGWTGSATSGSLAARSYRHTGQLGVEMTGGLITVGQTVNIPGGLTNPIMSFVYQVPSAAGNTLLVSVTNAAKSRYQYVPLLVNGQWIHDFVSLSGMTGPTEIKFTLRQGSGGVTPKVWIDEISVGAAVALPYQVLVPFAYRSSGGGW